MTFRSWDWKSPRNDEVCTTEDTERCGAESFTAEPPATANDVRPAVACGSAINQESHPLTGRDLRPQGSFPRTLAAKGV